MSREIVLKVTGKRMAGCTKKINRNQRGEIMKGGYESLIWVNDRNGKEYVCYLENTDNINSFDQLSEDARKRCSDVNQIVGTERW